LDVHHVGSISSGQIFLSCERTAPGHGIAMAMGMDMKTSIMKPMEVWFGFENDLNISKVLLRRSGWMKKWISPTDLLANLQTYSRSVKFLYENNIKPN